MENKLTLRGEFMPQQALLQIETLAEKLKDSGAMPSSISNGAQLMMVFMAGYEAGLTPMESMQSYYIVNGKVTMWGSSVITQLKRAGYAIEWIESDETKATVKLTSGDGKHTHTETFTLEEAKNAGLTGKDTWKKYPKDMLRHKAVARAVRFFCPEVLGGHYMTEDIMYEDGMASRKRNVRSSRNKNIEAEVIDTKPVEEPQEEVKERDITPVVEAWNELAALSKWNEEKAAGVLKQTLVRYYNIENVSDLSDEQITQFADNLRNKLEDIKSKQEETKEDDTVNTQTPEQIAQAFGGELVD